MDKEYIRKKYKKVRAEIDKKKEKSLIICSKIKSLKEFNKAKTIAVYSALCDEVDLSPLMDTNKIFLLPKVESKSNMNFYKAGEKYKKSDFGILEPYDSELYKKEQVDLIIIPLICADESRNRIGFGGGYYDRYLSDYTGFKVGVCFDEQISAEPLPCDKLDIKPDIIVSDKRIIK